jgi:dipicolinate synthase subunit A
MAEATVIVNTVPWVSCMPVDLLGGLSGRLIMDIASPPGGTDHAAVQAAGLGVLWLRGLVGERAPRTAGELQYRFVKNVIDSRSTALAAPAGNAAAPPPA